MGASHRSSIDVSQSMYVFLVSLKHSNLHPPPGHYHVNRHNYVANLSPEIQTNLKMKLKRVLNTSCFNAQSLRKRKTMMMLLSSVLSSSK